MSIFNWVAIKTDIVDLCDQHTDLSWRCSKVWKSTCGTACFTCLLFTQSFFCLLCVRSWLHMHNHQRSMQFHGTHYSKLYFSPLSQFSLSFLASLASPPFAVSLSFSPSLSLVLPHWSMRVNHLNILRRFHKAHIKNSGRWQQPLPNCLKTKRKSVNM